MSKSRKISKEEKVTIVKRCLGQYAEVLGWKAEKNLTDMCRDSWNWQRKNPAGYGK